TLTCAVGRMASEASNEAPTPFAFAVYGIDRVEAETDRRIETTPDDQIRAGPLGGNAEPDRRYQLLDELLEELSELPRRYQPLEQARRPGRPRNVASQTHGYREFIRLAASTGK